MGFVCSIGEEEATRPNFSMLVSRSCCSFNVLGGPSQSAHPLFSSVLVSCQFCIIEPRQYQAFGGTESVARPRVILSRAVSTVDGLVSVWIPGF
jgi:hypothetical protein